MPENMVIIPVSNWLGEIVKKSYLCKYPVKVIHNGINTEIFTDLTPKADDIFTKYKIAKDKFIILGVANLWEERKGLNDFIKLSLKLDSNTSIVLVGLTTAQKRILPSNIIGIERTQSIEELAALYRAANLFANLTWEDNFPTTNIEALACGCPVLTYNTGGSIEAITPETGFVVPQGDLEGVLKSIKQIRQNGKDYYRTSCRERAVNNFNKYIQFSEYIKLYNKCLKTKPY